MPFHAIGLADVPDTLTGNCGDHPGLACRLAWNITHNTNATQVVRVYLAGPVNQALRILFIIVIAFVVRAVAHRVTFTAVRESSPCPLNCAAR